MSWNVPPSPPCGPEALKLFPDALTLPGRPTMDGTGLPPPKKNTPTMIAERIYCFMGSTYFRRPCPASVELQAKRRFDGNRWYRY